ncbi:MAG TPA: phospholipase D-like domain-containing protein [Myxococcota bacterium]|nr:phospholipase D-like domain-containing protein [Myxococcota bacterium]
MLAVLWYPMWTMGLGMQGLARARGAAIGSHSKRVLHVGGPGARPGALRDLLAENVRAVPAGGRISFLTYYFRDRALAGELVAAHERGVHVRVLVEGRTRTRGANRHALALLAPVLGRALRVIDRPYALRVHAKLYVFAGAGAGDPKRALIGSFNPSSDADELDPEVIADIGDQDRAFNALVALEDDATVEWLLRQTERLHASAFARAGRFPLAWPQAYEAAADALWMLPRFGASPLLERVVRLRAGARLRLTATHLSGTLALRALSAASARGVRVELLAEGTERRVPPALEAQLRAAGIAVTRVASIPHVPMHAKFCLVEDGAEREAWFGSANWSDRSFLRNFEVLARSRDAALFDAFASYWAEIEGFARAART